MGQSKLTKACTGRKLNLGRLSSSLSQDNTTLRITVKRTNYFEQGPEENKIDNVMNICRLLTDVSDILKNFLARFSSWRHLMNVIECRNLFICSSFYVRKLIIIIIVQNKFFYKNCWISMNPHRKYSPFCPYYKWEVFSICRWNMHFIPPKNNEIRAPVYTGKLFLCRLHKARNSINAQARTLLRILWAHETFRRNDVGESMGENRGPSSRIDARGR